MEISLLGRSTTSILPVTLPHSGWNYNAIQISSSKNSNRKTLSGLHFVLARENNSSWEKSNLILKCEVILQGQSLFFCLYCFTKSIYILLNKLKVQMSQAEDCTGIITNLSAEV